MRFAEPLHRIDEVAVLAPDRVAFGRAHRASAADIDHDLAVGQFDRQPVGKKMQADTMAPAQQAVADSVATAPVAKSKVTAVAVATSRPGKSVGTRCPARA